MTVQRLNTRTRFQAVLAAPTLARTAHFALHGLAWPMGDEVVDGVGESAAMPFALPERAHVWLGAQAPKRWAKRAVTRNGIKRQIYAWGQAHADALPPAAYVVRLRAEFSRKQFVSAWSDALRHAVQAELQTLLARSTSARNAEVPA